MFITRDRLSGGTRVAVLLCLYFLGLNCDVLPFILGMVLTLVVMSYKSDNLKLAHALSWEANTCKVI